MNQILNFGSLNQDRTYHVKEFVQAGETILAQGYEEFCGGKGLNQSIAAARAAGGAVYHGGAVGTDGAGLVEALKGSGVDVRYLQTLEGPSGHAIIQINERGQNCIIVYGGTNVKLTRPYIDGVLDNFGAGDFLILQNEINEVPYIMERAHRRGMRLVFNPSPITKELCENYPLDLVEYFILNEIEGAALSGVTGSNQEVLEGLHKRFPDAAIVLTVGDQGVLYARGEERLSRGIYSVPVVDTTAAGDTFCGYFVAALAQGLPAEEGLRRASAAAALAVSVMGAAPSIPNESQVSAFLEERG
ncbi:ribokinase [Pseudoflavonifractor sp. AF19-9AC]|nr:ribokinase [Pseudoflavonifractor sp. AF19-9AC]RHR10390.1 ribokinase [Pseudoflavonifractor sp. AF19-9AC]